MKILVDINHPAHVHYFRNFIGEMQKRGHEVLVTATEKEMTYRLLEQYHIAFYRMGPHRKSVLRKIINLPIMDLKMIQAAKTFRPDIFVAYGSIRAAHAAAVLRRPCINFEDTEHETGQIALFLPFVTCVCTPSCFRGDLGPKQVRFRGYLELAHLHPNRFVPDPSVLREAGLAETDTFTIVRFVAWGATHDLGHHGITDKVGFVRALEQYGRVIITSEGDLPPELRPNQMKIPPEKIHHLLSYATLYVGEGGTMAAEAAVLGTPSLYVSTLAGTMGNFIELEETYGLLFSFQNPDAALEKAVEILRNTNSKEQWKAKRERMLIDKIDVTAFMVRLVENYPYSIEELKNRAVL